MAESSQSSEQRAVAEEAGQRPRRLAIVVSHPIPHFTPFYRALAQEAWLDLKVLFASKVGLEPYHDREMGAQITWAVDTLGGYEHEFLPGADAIDHVGFRTVNNSGVGEALARFEPDVVLLHGYWQITLLRALVWCRTHGVPALVIGDGELRSPRSRLRSALKYLPLRLLTRQFAAVLSVGDANEEHWRHYGAPAEKLFRSPFTIDEDVYREARADRRAMQAAFRAEIGVPQDAIVAIQIGKLSERKRPLDLIDAAALLLREGRRLHCVYAGDGALMPALEARVAETGVAASLLGFVNLDRLPSVYASADVIVHPASADPHPLVMSEAACVGLPLVISDRIGAEGPTDIARSGVNAETFPCGDVPALAAALGRVAFDPSVRSRMSEASRRVFDELDMRRSISGLEAAIASCT